MCNLTAEKAKVVAGSEHLEIPFYENFPDRSELTFPSSFEDIPLFDLWDHTIQYQILNSVTKIEICINNQSFTFTMDKLVLTAIHILSIKYLPSHSPSYYTTDNMICCRGWFR